MGPRPSRSSPLCGGVTDHRHQHTKAPNSLLLEGEIAGRREMPRALQKAMTCWWQFSGPHTTQTTDAHQETLHEQSLPFHPLKTTYIPSSCRLPKLPRRVFHQKMLHRHRKSFPSKKFWTRAPKVLFEVVPLEHVPWEPMLPASCG